MANLEQTVEERIKLVANAEAEVTKLENELSADPKFKAWLEAQKNLKEANKKNEEFFDALQEQMEARANKTGENSIKGDWGSITLAERIGWDVDEEQLPKKFFKKVVDTKKITDTFRLEGKAPKGATKKVTKYITKRFK